MSEEEKKTRKKLDPIGKEKSKNEVFYIYFLQKYISTGVLLHMARKD